MLFKNKYRIESSRLKGYNYSTPGAYYVTIVTKNRKCLFGNIENNKMIYNEVGKIVDNFWSEIPIHFPYVNMDEYVIMPNHLHGIIFIDETIKPAILTIVETPDVETPDVETPDVETPKLGVSTNDLKIRQPVGVIINQFKRACTIEIRKIENNFGWQSRFHDRIIRDENELNRIRQYIINNPLNWKSDEHFL